MESEPTIAELSARLSDLESELGLRVTALERRVASLMSSELAAAPPPPARPTSDQHSAAAIATQAAGTAPAGSTAAAGGPPPPPRLGDAVGARPVRQPRPTAAERYEVTVESVLRWVGIGLVVLAAVFLVRTAIDRGWIGPELQLLGATLIGLGLLGGGARLVESRRAWGLALANAGAAVIIICAGASYGWLELWDATTGLGLVAIAAAVAVLVAMRLRLESVAVTATAAMLVVPAWARIIADAPVLATGVWLGMFAVVATVVGIERAWPFYRLSSTWAAALWVIGLAGFLASDGNTDHLVSGVALVSVVGLVLWLGPALSQGRGPGADGGRTDGGIGRSHADSIRAVEHRSVLLLPLWAWLATILFGGFDVDQPGGWIGLAMAGGFLALAIVAGPVSRRIGNALFVANLLGASLLITVSLVAALGGPTLLVALAGQALATLLIANLFDDGLLKLNGYLLAGGAWLFLAAELSESIDRAELLVGETAGAVVTTVILAAIAWLTERSQRAELAQVVFGMVWFAVLGLVASLLAPVVEREGWLAVGVAMAMISLFVAFRLGPWVLAIGGVASVVVTVAGGLSILAAAVDGTSVLGHLTNLSVVVGLALAVAWLWSRGAANTALRSLHVTVMAVAWVWFLAWIASVFLTELDGSIRQVAISVAWAIAACVAIVAAIRTDDAAVRVLGLGTLAVVLIKLLSIDLAEVDTLWRVGLFLVIGLGLLRLGYILPALAKRYGPAAEQEVSSPAPRSVAGAGPRVGD